MNRTKLKPLVVCRAGPQAEAFRKLGVRTEAVRVPPFPRRSRFMLMGARIYDPREVPQHLAIFTGVLSAAFRFKRDEGIDIIHGSGLFSNVYASAAGIALRKPVVWNINDMGPLENRRLFLLLERSTAKTIAVSKTLEEKLVNSGFSRGKVELIYEAVDTGSFHPMDKAGCRAKLGLEEKKRLVGFVSRLEKGKGLEQFMNAAALIANKHGDVVFLVVGKPSDETYIEGIRDLVERLGLKSRVLFLGFRRDIPVVMNALDVLVFPTALAEGFGLVPAEASACGIPVVATDVGPVREIIKDGETGIIVPVGDAKETAQSVISLLENPALAERMGAAGRERVKLLFPPDLHQMKLERVYEEILE